jgi:hypothetical protein
MDKHKNNGKYYFQLHPHRHIYIHVYKDKKNLGVTKEEEAENSYRMGLWHFTPFLNKRAPN